MCSFIGHGERLHKVIWHSGCHGTLVAMALHKLQKTYNEKNFKNFSETMRPTAQVSGTGSDSASCSALIGFRLI